MTELRPDELPPPAWNATARDYPVALLHEAFEAQVARTPEAPAIRFRDESLSYRELNGRANRLARYLVELRAGPGSLVAVCMDRSLEMVVSLYAILKAGAAYVPIDPEYPADRMSFMLADTAAPILLTQQALVGRFAGSAAQIVPVDRVTDAIADREAADVPSGAALDDLAYVIYTSGSTGQPKGAMITHRAISNRLVWMQEAFGLTAADRVLQKTPFSFDVSVWEFFWPLLFGAELVIAEPGGHRDSTYLTQVIVDRGITTIHFVPSMLQLFLEDPRAADCTGLTRVICSGEALPKALHGPILRAAAGRAPQPVRPHRGGRRCDMVGVRSGERPGVRPHRQADREHPDPHRRCGPAALCRSERPGSCASAASRSPAATSTGRSCRPSGSSRTRSRRTPTPGCTGPATCPGSCPTATSSSWAGATSRSRSGASGWSSARSRRPWRRSRASARPSSWPGRGRAAISSSWPTSCPPTARDGRRTRIRVQLLARLPEYMVPTTFVVLDRFPQTLERQGRPEGPARSGPFTPGGRDAVRGPADTARAAHRRCVAAGPGRGVSRCARPVLRARRHLAPGRALRQRDADRAGRDDLRRHPVRRPVDRRVRRVPAGGLSRRRRPAGGRGPAADSRARPVASPSPRRTSPGFGLRCPCSARTPRTPATGTRRRSSS